MDKSPVFSFMERRRPSTSSWHILNMKPLPEVPDDNSLPWEHPSQQNNETSLSNRIQDLALDEQDVSGWSQHLGSKSNTGPRHESNKSFATLNHALNELRSVSRRASLSIRRKSILSPRTLNAPSDEEILLQAQRPSTSHNLLSGPPNSSRSSGWLRRVASGGFRQRRNSSTQLSPTDDRVPHIYNVTSPVPGSGSEPPIVPHDPASGAAARAAAAAQNEMLGVGRVLILREDNLFSEPKLARDSESGIGIDLRDRTDETAEPGITVVRKGKTASHTFPYRFTNFADDFLLQILPNIYQQSSSNTFYPTWILLPYCKQSWFPEPGEPRPQATMFGNTHFKEPMANPHSQVQNSLQGQWLGVQD